MKFEGKYYYPKDLNPIIDCECGCGNFLLQYSNEGYERKTINNHNIKNMSKEDRLKLSSYPKRKNILNLVKFCECGCGIIILAFGDNNHKNRFIAGHNLVGKPQSKKTKDKRARIHMKKMNITSGLENDEIITGLLLSDGHLSKITSQYQNSRLQLGQSLKYKEMVDYIEKYLNDIGFSTNKKTYVAKLGDVINLNTRAYPDFTVLRKKWYPKGVKIVPNDLKLTAKSLAWLYMGDGGSSWIKKNIQKSIVNIATDGFDLKDVKIIKTQIENFGISNVHIRYRGLIRKDGKPRPYIDIAKSSEVEKFFTLIEPYVLPIFQYKIKHPFVHSRKEAISELGHKYGGFLRKDESIMIISTYLEYENTILTKQEIYDEVAKDLGFNREERLHIAHVMKGFFKTNPQYKIRKSLRKDRIIELFEKYERENISRTVIYDRIEKETGIEHNKRKLKICSPIYAYLTKLKKREEN